jgi:ATP-dependent helicase/DNAse subunit B
VVPGVKPYDKLAQTKEAASWAEVLRNWRAALERLGEAFRDGDARVDPKDYPKTCLYCELKSLCRIHELRALDNREILGEEEGP